VYYYNNRAYHDDSYVYVADTGNHAIRKIKTSNMIVTTLAGGNGPGLVNGPVASAKFDSPESLTVGSDGAVYVADTGNNCIRKIYQGVVSTYEANFARPTKICFGANGKLYVTGSEGVKLLL
jgi:sugar lactone lactonase YvrE